MDVILEKLRERHVGRVPEWAIIIAVCAAKLLAATESESAPNCGALMYTDEEYATKLAEWEAEDEAERAFWSMERIV